MTPLVYELLPIHAQEIVLAVEAASGLQIEVRQTAKDRFLFPGEGNSARIFPTHERIFIEHDAPIHQMPISALVHELAHAQRWYVEGVPHIQPVRTMDVDNASAIENDLEHLVIYGRVTAICPEVGAQTVSALLQAWDEYPWGLNGPALTHNQLVKAGLTSLYGNATGSQAMRRALATDHSAAAVRKGAAQLLRLRGNKRALVAAHFDLVGIPREGYRLRLLNAAARSFSDEVIAG